MRSRLLPLGASLACLPAVVLVAGATGSHKHKSGPIRSAKDAKSIAEQETGGKAVSARRIPLNGASGGWEVEVHMPREAKGWRCVIDADTRMVHTKTRIEQPDAKGGSEGPIRVVKGSR